jgi:5-methylcytosine-specific restriction enzyme A
MPVTKGSGNPKWTRDETILALDLYLKLGRAPGPNHPDIIALSALLNRMPWHSLDSRTGTFRNSDGVSLKLLNMRSFERGRGLSYSKIDAEVFTELASHPETVATLANTIRKAIDLDEVERKISQTTASNEGLEWEFAEGRLLTEIHVRRERSPKVRQALIASRKKRGWLACDLCRWSYGQEPEAFCEAAFEAHHLLPLALLVEGRKTKLEDVALLCANCHRLIHRAISLEKRWLSLAAARTILRFPSNGTDSLKSVGGL